MIFFFSFPAFQNPFILLALGNVLNLSLFPPDFNVGQNGEMQDRDRRKLYKGHIALIKEKLQKWKITVKTDMNTNSLHS